jgi:hypothetical protein
MGTWLLIAQNGGDVAIWTGGGLVLISIVLALAGLAIWIWALVDAIGIQPSTARCASSGYW